MNMLVEHLATEDGDFHLLDSRHSKSVVRQPLC